MYHVLVSGLIRCQEFLDVVSGSSVTLKCRFDPQLNQKRSTLYWIRSNRINHDNVAIGETAFHQDYRSVYLAASRGCPYITSAAITRQGHSECLRMLT